MTLAIAQNFDKSVSATLDSVAGSPTATVNVDATVTVGVDVNVSVIPVELFTSFRMLYIVTVFGGFGFDYNMGKASSIASINGPITVSDSMNALTGVSGDAELDLGQDASPAATNEHALLHWRRSQSGPRGREPPVHAVAFADDESRRGQPARLFLTIFKPEREHT